MVASETMKAALGRIAAQDDDAIDLAEAALVLAAIDHPATDLAVYRQHLAALADHVKAAARAIEPEQAAPEELARALSQTLADEFRYLGDEDTYNDLDNANLMRVIERR